LALTTPPWFPASALTAHNAVTHLTDIVLLFVLKKLLVVGATKPRFAVVLLMILTLGVSLGLPAEDVLDAVYDESETLPCEGTPSFSIVLSPVATRITRSPLSSLHPEPGTPLLLVRARVRDTDAHRSADAQVSLALLCTLLC
jgi:hypothetical protein